MEDTTKCGSPHCIAGWAAWLEQGKPEELVDNRRFWSISQEDGPEQNSIVSSALQFLDTTDDDFQIRRHLFGGEYNWMNLERVTKTEAIEALELLRDTETVRRFPSLIDEKEYYK